MGSKVNGFVNGHVHEAPGAPLNLTVLGLNSGTSMVGRRYETHCRVLLIIDCETGWR